MEVTINTERLRIRPINLQDAAFMLELVNSEGWLKFIGERNVSDLDDAKNYIQKILDTEQFYYCVFELKGSQKAIGIVSLIKRENEQYPDFGFALLPSFEKKGYAHEASRAYLEKIVRSKKYEHIIAITLPHNQRSSSLLKKLGFAYEGDGIRDRETLSYFILKNR
jgi:RimJ/RimL family protein N-acetyltransferase